MSYPHHADVPGSTFCLCGAYAAGAKIEDDLWGSDCPAAMREHIATLTAENTRLQALVDGAPRPAENTGDCRTCGHDTFGKCSRPIDDLDKEVTRWTNYQLDDDAMTRLPDSPSCPGYRAKETT